MLAFRLNPTPAFAFPLAPPSNFKADEDIYAFTRIKFPRGMLQGKKRDCFLQRGAAGPLQGAIWQRKEKRRGFLKLFCSRYHFPGMFLPGKKERGKKKVFHQPNKSTANVIREILPCPFRPPPAHQLKARRWQGALLIHLCTPYPIPISSPSANIPSLKTAWLPSSFCGGACSNRALWGANKFICALLPSLHCRQTCSKQLPVIICADIGGRNADCGSTGFQVMQGLSFALFAWDGPRRPPREDQSH